MHNKVRASKRERKGEEFSKIGALITLFSRVLLLDRVRSLRLLYFFQFFGHDGALICERKEKKRKGREGQLKV